MKEKTTLEKMKELYGFSEGNLEYIPKSGELLRYIGTEVALLEYTKDKTTGNWSNTITKALIVSIYDYDPMTSTYSLKYKKDKEKEVKEVRIISEGFSNNDPEETGTSLRFIPFSMNFKFQEDRLFYERLEKEYNNFKNLPIDVLKIISGNNEQDKLLKLCNISAVIKTDNDGMLYFRITKLKIKHNQQKKYALTISSDKGKLYTFQISSNQDEYDFSYGGEFVGKLKIVDIQGNKED